MAWLCDNCTTVNIESSWKLGAQVGCVTRMNRLGLVKIQMWMLEVLWFFTIERSGQKLYLKKSWTDSDKTWWKSWVGDNNKPIRFWLRYGCRSGLSAIQQATKCKMVSLMEVCTLPSAVLVLQVTLLQLYTISTWRFAIQAQKRRRNSTHTWNVCTDVRQFLPVKMAAEFVPRVIVIGAEPLLVCTGSW